MESKVSSIPPPPAAATAPQPTTAPDVSRPVIGADAADLRLVIEQDEGSGSYVYKTVDRRTGEIVQQFPRDQILRMREGEKYAAGAVISAKA